MATAERKLCHQDYTVAWVCALALEMAAAEAMLDEIHPQLPTKPNDYNTYILGKIYNHNIVIACLPSGVYGTTSAAALAAQLQSTFTAIRFNLMVGIGGGIPSEKSDIRLGDVVISNPTRDFGGVLQYDFGKTVGGGRFERTAILNKPPPILLTAVSRLQAAHMSATNRISGLISEMIIRKPLMEEKFTYRGEDQDLLFDSEYDHPHSEDTCASCDTAKLIIRPPRATKDPIIHYGLIASGNQVMKHGKTRDKLAKELGILCFEMEAAGLMDNFPCLVIRGICDYSDSHKNKQWQEYAAVTAAACTKELLSVIHTNQVVDTPASDLASDLSYYSRSAPYRMQPPAELTLYKKIHQRLLDRISSYDHERIHQRLCRKRLPGTTQWFFDQADFKEWFTGQGVRSLWCSGKIGSGKTMIASAVVEAVKYRTPETRSPVVFFYCGDEHPDSLSSSYILSSFIKQLREFMHLTSKPCPSGIMREINKFFGDDRTPPGLHDLEDIFIRLFDILPHAIYILDGVDALAQEHSKHLLKILQPLFPSTRSGKSRILLLSRDQVPGYMDISTFMPGIRRISTSDNILPDIKAYIETSINDKTMCRKISDDPLLVEEIKRVLLTESKEMFLWVYLQLEILWDTCHSDAEIRSILASLPKDLEETYGRCVQRMDLDDHRVLKVLKWVSFATRPLHIDELREAVTFDYKNTSWNAELIPTEQFIIGCCANLVVLDPSDSHVRFTHPSVKQYLGKCRDETPWQTFIPGYPLQAQGDLECGELCITYLSFTDFSLQLSHKVHERAELTVPSPMLLGQEVPGFSITKFLFRSPTKQKTLVSVPFHRIRTACAPDRTRYRFLNYAISNWAVHTKMIGTSSSVWEKFARLATSFNETWDFHPWMSGGRSQFSQLHALFGWAVNEQHEPLLSIALAARPDLKQVCDLPLVNGGLPALHTAAKLGYTSIFWLLLNICNPNAPDHEGQTALHHAASNGHSEICMYLLGERGIKLNAQSKSGCTPLWLAASNGHEDTVILLIRNRASIEAKNSSTLRSALSQAAGNGHTGTVRLLLEEGADHNSEGADGGTPLSWAIRGWHQETMKLLLEEGARTDAKDIDRYSLLFWAARNGYHEAIICMGVRGVDLGRRDLNGGTLLSCAAAGGHERTVGHLLLMGADPNTHDRDGKTPLHHVCMNGHEEVGQLLLLKGANAGSKDNDGRTPMHWAANNGHGAVVRVLLKKGSKHSVKDHYGKTPLDCAEQNCHGTVIELLSRNDKYRLLPRLE